jgi:hypothetical protein
MLRERGCSLRREARLSLLALAITTAVVAAAVAIVIRGVVVILK